MSGVASEAFVMMLVAAAIGSMLGYALTIQSGKFASRLVTRVDQRMMNRIVILFLVIIVPVTTGYWGVIILAMALMVGYIPVTCNMGKTVLCGCLILPSLLT